MTKVDLRTLPDAEAQRLLKEQLDYNPETGEFRWRVSKGRGGKGNIAGTKLKTGYILIRINDVTYFAHRLAWLYTHGQQPKPHPFGISHINGIRDDNRISNLEQIEINVAPNGLHPMNTSGYTGVVWRKKQQRWEARLIIKGKAKYYGTFKNKEDAIAARLEAEKKYRS